MQAHISFAGEVEFVQENTWTVRVRAGREFVMTLISQEPISLKWTSTKDRVLQVDEIAADKAAIKTLNKGTSEVILLDSEYKSEFRLTFDVFDPAEAAQLEIPSQTTESIT